MTTDEHYDHPKKGSMMKNLSRTRFPASLGSVFLGLMAVMAASLIIGCSNEDSKSDTSGADAGIQQEAVQLWTCGMHPEVLTEEAGQCPICGMNLVQVKQDGSMDEGMDSMEASELWTCSMHPEVLKDEAGDCPICGMDLVPVRKDNMQHDDADLEHTAQVWTCSMHPEVVKDTAGDCPICGMDLVPVKVEPTEKLEPEAMDMGERRSGGPAEGSKKILYWRAPMDPTFIRDKPGTSPMGMDLVPVYEGDESFAGGAAVIIDPVTVQNIGIQTEKVVEQRLSKMIRAVGYVDYDEGALSRINVKYSGWVERLHVDQTGQKIRKGDKLLELYSPELVSTQRELVLALENERRTTGSSFSDVSTGGRSLVEATRQRLRYWDITERQIRDLEESSEVTKTVTLYAPVDGIVTMKTIEKGMRVMPGMDLFRIANLSTMWVYAHFYDSEVQWIQHGQNVTVEFPYIPGKQIQGTVDFIYPYMDKKTRDTKVRIVLENPGLDIRPKMYANVLLESELESPVLTIPTEAILRSGTRNIVFVDRGNGKFEPRNVVLGIQGNDGLVQILGGVSEGEDVVTSAQFLLDSESRLKEAIQKMLRERSKKIAGK